MARRKREKNYEVWTAVTTTTPSSFKRKEWQPDREIFGSYFGTGSPYQPRSSVFSEEVSGVIITGDDVSVSERIRVPEAATVDGQDLFSVKEVSRDGRMNVVFLEVVKDG